MSDEEYKAEVMHALERFPQLTARQKECTVQLYARYRAYVRENQRVDWAKVRALPGERFLRYEELPSPTEAEVVDALKKVAMLKLNGGLGTSMGCSGPKSLLPVREGHTFLDFSLDQLAWLNEKHGTDVPLVLMNSFNTDAQTKDFLAKRVASGRKMPRTRCFCQFELPRMDKSTGLPADLPADTQFYPPGHGFVYECLLTSGVAAELVASGVEWLFISNADNLGATLDPQIAAALVKATSGEKSLETNALPQQLLNINFLSEQTPKSPADVKGGVLIDYDGRTKLLETAQVPAGHESNFCDVKTFPFFHINNLWVNLKALLSEGAPQLDLIVNPKKVHDKDVIQLEVAAGAAIACFRAAGLVVPRSRFRPVKKTGDLMLVQSDCFSVNERYCLVQEVEALPNVKVNHGVSEYEQMFASGIPSLRGASEVVIDGAVKGQTEKAVFRGRIHVGADETLVVEAGKEYGETEDK